ncbi:hypothetical protein [Streptomyces acidiscabies]|uniref:hypothetical protein n=1 Tax=Streptomyces acidiscabies TaxID=42234 RepID=UPI000951F73D|nr:hypothetical protein [Streptomyces acidiscabies]
MQIDLSEVRETVRQLAERLEELDGTEADETLTRVGNRQRTEISRNLQYLAHLGDKTSVQVVGIFYAFRKWDAEGPTGRRAPQ